MSPAENHVLLALAALVSRQRALSLGKAPAPLYRALVDPPQFSFEWRGAQMSCIVDAARLGMFWSSVLFVEERAFVAPVPSLQAHLEVSARADGGALAVFTRPFVERLGIDRDSRPFAVYSPLHVAYSARTGFFNPRREGWHAYLARALAARLDGSSRSGDGDAAVSWRAGAVHLRRGPPALVRFKCETLEFTLTLAEDGFELVVSRVAEAHLGGVLEAFCRQQPMPLGVTARVLHGDGAVQITTYG